MIAGIGTDLVDISRMQGLIERHSEGIVRRILAPQELVDWQASRDQPRFLAKRFAAKEALAKALGTGVRAPVLLTAIYVGHDAAGKPELGFAPELAEHLRQRGITAYHLSISDERSHALAFVVLECADAAPTREMTP